MQLKIGVVKNHGDQRTAPAWLEYRIPIQVVEFPLLGQGGVARSAGVVRSGDSTNQIGSLYQGRGIFGNPCGLEPFTTFPVTGVVRR